MLNSFSGKAKKDILKEDIDILLNEWNLERIYVMCVLIFLMQVANIFDTGVRETPYLLFGVGLYSAGAIIWFVLLKVFLEVIRVSENITSIMVVAFWVFFILGDATFVIRDAEMGRTPVSCFISLVVLTLVPIFRERIRFFLLTLAALVGVLGNHYFHSELSYQLFIVVFFIGGCSVSELVSNRSIEIIKQLNQLSTHDALTGLYNRGSGMSRASVMFSMNEREYMYYCVMMGDVDYFKAINDSFGHNQGDKALEEIADAIQSVFKRKHDIVCRMGGEEFAIFFVSDKEETIEYLAKETLKKVEGRKIKAGRDTVSPYATISLGYSYSRCDSEFKGLEKLMSEADTAMYEAKRQGRNRAVRFQAEMEMDEV